MLSAIALVVSYFSGPMLNYGDFARYGKSFAAVKKGNFLGLPVNFLVFALLVVVTAAATQPVFGELITDPVETVARLDSTFAVVLGALTFMIATVGINIVANFVSPAFDFSNVNPQKISWRMGGMIAAVGSVLLTPWNLYSSPEVIHYTLDTLGAFIGPLYGVLICDYYLIKKQRVVVDDLYTLQPDGTYHYTKGYNPVPPRHHVRRRLTPPSSSTPSRFTRSKLDRCRTGRACLQQDGHPVPGARRVAIDVVVGEAHGVPAQVGQGEVALPVHPGRVGVKWVSPSYSMASRAAG